MTTPAWLQAAALLLWGFASGQQALAALLAVARLLAAASGVRLTLSDRDLNRAVDLSALAVLLTGAGFLLVQGLPQGLLAGTGWLPAALFPLLLVDALSATPLRLRHLALTLRRSAHAQADRLANLGAPYLAMTLLAASVLARPSPWFFWALASVLVLWLYAARPAPRTPALAAFVLAALVAIAVAHAVGAGLQRTQLALQEWGIDALSDTDPDPYHSQTRIGDLGRVKRSERILWRVEQAPPAVAPLLLRNGVFSRYANGAWLARRDSFTPLPPAPASGQAWLTLHGQSRQGIAIVPVPIGAEPVGNERAMLQRNAYGIIRAEAAPPLLDVVVARAPLAASTQPEAADLSLPPAFAELLQRLPALAALAPGSAQERLTGLQDWFAGHFRYTLFLGDEQRGGRDLERFLLTDRAGHCEYFASATVLLLRALGIPARYVTGYSVQEYSRLEAAFVVRQRHAHAWAEGFVDGRWVEVDTTPSTWLTVEEDAAPFWRPLADLLSFAWRRFAEWRRDVAASEFPVTTLALVAPLAALLAWLVLRRARPRRKSGRAGTGDAPEDPAGAEMRSFRALEQEFALRGFGRRLGEPPRAWLARLDREGRPVLGGPRLTAAGELIEALYRERYGPRVTTHSPPAPESANPFDAGSIRVKKTPPRRGQQNKRGNPE